MIACSHPIRLRGSQDRIDGVTGELLARIVTAREPGGVLLVSCGDRRAGHCASCAETYRYDAFHLVASGLRGGKRVPETVAANPAVMVTFTAPSFGSVHTIRDRDGLCPCGKRHDNTGDELGTPIDPTSYRYLDQVAWNHLAPTLWKLTVQAMRRHLARELGVARHRLNDVVRMRFVKVAEFQRRGVVHYHAVFRLDGPEGAATEPPSRCTAALLERAVRAAAREVCVNVPDSSGLRLGRRFVCWGRQLEIVRLGADDVDGAAGYFAKYATKATENAAGGLLFARVRTARGIVALDAPPHAKRLVETAWRLGSVHGFAGARRWAHQFGYGGHTLTKSRDYSVTFAALRDARAAWRAGRSIDPLAVVRRGRLSYAGRGHAFTRSRLEHQGPTLDLAMTGGSGA
jgi:hypothetical protein